METVWKIASLGFTLSFLVFLLGTALSERLTNVGWDHLQTWSAWSWFGAAGIVFVVGWFSIIWKPIPNHGWMVFVFITAHIVFLGQLFLWIPTRGQGFGFGGVLG